MDHGHHHGSHGGGDDMMMCNMNMLFTWDTTNLCIIFPGWRISGVGSLIISLIAIVAMTAGYELVRELSRRYEAKIAQPITLDRNDSVFTRRIIPILGFVEPSGDSHPLALDEGEHDENSSLLRSGRSGKSNSSDSLPERKTIRGVFYAVQVFYSFFIMLLFMTYNGWVMLAVTVGAFVGFMLFSGNAPATKTVACH